MRYRSLVSGLCVLLAMIAISSVSVSNAQKISDLPNFTGVVSDSDLFPMVDVSDTGISSSGTTKKITALNSKAWLKSYFDTLYLSSFDYAPVDTEAELAAAIAASTPVILARANITLTGNHTLAIGQTYSALPGAIITTNGNVFDLSYGYLEDNGGQMFNSSPNEVEFGQYPTINPRMFGPNFNGTNGDANAWQCALYAFPATGGKLIHDGVSVVESTLIWPNDGTNCYPIVIEGGQSRAQTGTFNTVDAGGPGQIKYTGTTGALFDMRNGDNSLLNWSGALKNLRLSGPYTFTAGTPNVETNAATIGLNLYMSKQSKIENTTILVFGKGINLDGTLGNAYWYYSSWRDVIIYGNKYGVYGYMAHANGTSLHNIRVSNNRMAGIYLDYPGDIVSLSGWCEYNATHAAKFDPAPGSETYGGVVINHGRVVNLSNMYLEGNGGQHAIISGDPLYRTILNVTGNHFTWSAGRYSLNFRDIDTLNLIGNRLESYNGASAPGGTGYVINLAGHGHVPVMNTLGNTLPDLRPATDTNTAIIQLMVRSELTNSNHRDGFNSAIFMDRVAEGADYIDTISENSIFFPDQLDKADGGGALAWLSTVPGSGASADLNGTEPGDVQPDGGQNYSLGTISNGARRVTVVGYDSTGTPFATDAHKTGLFVNRVIQIDNDGAVSNGAFVPATFSDGTTYAKIVRVVTTGTSNCEIDLDKTLSDPTITGGLIRPNALNRKYAHGWTWYKSKTSVSSSGAGEDNLMVADTLTAAMLKTDSTIPILARGTITGTAGNHTLKIYLGTTAFTILSGTTTEGAWRFQGEIQVTAAAAQTLSGLFWNADGVAYIETDATEAISGALALKMTGECANGADTITQSLFVVDLK